MQIEKRSEKRISGRVVDVNCYCRVEFGNAHIMVCGKVIDLSNSGVRLQLPYELSPQETIRISDTFLFDSFIDSQISVVVKWCKKVSSGLFEIGLEVPQANLNLIERFAKQQLN